METTSFETDKTEWNTYMKNYYEANKEKQKARNRSYKLQKKAEVSSGLKEEYGMYVADILKLKKIIDHLPSELWTKCLNELAPKIAV